MITMIAAALAAAQPAAVPANPPAQPAPMMQMDQRQGHEQNGQMADMSDCCCHDMMAKMHGGHPAAHEGHSGE